MYVPNTYTIWGVQCVQPGQRETSWHAPIPCFPKSPILPRHSGAGSGKCFLRNSGSKRSYRSLRVRAGACYLFFAEELNMLYLRLRNKLSKTRCFLCSDNSWQAKKSYSWTIELSFFSFVEHLPLERLLGFFLRLLILSNFLNSAWERGAILIKLLVFIMVCKPTLLLS